jgi:hypothetical protein
MSIDASTSRHAVAGALSGWDGSPVIVDGKTIDHQVAPTIHDARRYTLEAGEGRGVGFDVCDAWVDVGMVRGPRNDRYAAVYVYGEAIGEWRKDSRGWRFVRC